MGRTDKQVYEETYGIVKKLPKKCELCGTRLVRKGLHNDLAMIELKKFNPATGKEEPVYKELINPVTKISKKVIQHLFVNKMDGYKDKYNYMLACPKCPMSYEVIISKKMFGNKQLKEIIQVF